MLLSGLTMQAQTIYVHLNDTTTIAYNMDYVDSISFKPRALPQEISKENGILPGRFSVAADKMVKFSQGNLQYQATTGTWRLAENQYDFVGDDNENAASDYEGWIDLFGWGASGYNNVYPYSTSTSSSNYGSGQIEGSNFDWGVYNAISNGGDQAGMWRILSLDEWNYLLKYRKKASALRTYATVNGVEGWILLPDNWIVPEDVALKPSNSKGNDYDLEAWKKLEVRGAVFLPEAGYRNGTDINGTNSMGKYWTSATSSSSMANCLKITEGSYNTTGESKYSGLSVRLVLSE